MTARSLALFPVSTGSPTKLSTYSVMAVHSLMQVPSSSSSTGTVAYGFFFDERREPVFAARNIDRNELNLVRQSFLGERDADARGIRKTFVVVDFQHVGTSPCLGPAGLLTIYLLVGR